METIRIAAQVGSGKPKIAGLAYSGGKMRLTGWSQPVVVDLAGMEIPGNIPLLLDHQNRTDCRIGVIEAKIEAGGLHIAGEIVSESEDAAEVALQGKSGAPWQLSIGADVTDFELIKSGSVAINEQAFEAPFYHVKKSILREVSVVAVGADANTEMKVAAKAVTEHKGEIMEEKKEKVEAVVAAAAAPAPAIPPAPVAEETVRDAVRAERERVIAIQAICAGEFPEIEKQAVAAGWDEPRTTAEVLKAVRAQRPAADVNISVHSAPEGAELRNSIEAAMCLRSGISADSLEKSYGAGF